ncbi:MAG: glycoside hydrolase family 36 N-terminal domain-containing protein, partial [Sedimentisphaerales bacterium]|nr:glycoside hydrolase family 36 N-terminal domain-containing protein [Sedimentisphaerales bacterium]
MPDPADPTLRLWLKADDLNSTHNAGDAVTQWVDASSYGTVFEPNAAWNEAPHFARVGINPPTVVSAIQFDASGDSGIPGTRDRLWQTNNRAPSADPLNMGAGQPMTVIVVYSNSAAAGELGPYMPLITKRGNSSCVWMFANNNVGSTSQLCYVTYDTLLVYYSGSPYVIANRWNVSAMTIGASDALSFYQDGDQNATVDLQLTGSSPQSIIGRNASTSDPAGIACFSQSCCGRGETFAGCIAEIIIYSRILSSAEMSGLEEYLTAKYFVGEVQLDPQNPVDPNKTDYRPAFCGDKGTVLQLADLSQDCYTNFTDFANLASQWLTFSSSTVSQWNYANDFATANGNPNSVWSYGYFDGSNNFIQYNQLGAPPSPLINWTWNGNPDINGNANKNTDTANSYIRTDWGPGMGWRPGQCCIMTPSTNLTFKPAGRFIAPAAGTYNVSIAFENRVVNNGQPSGVFVRVGNSEVLNTTVTGYQSGPENYANYAGTLSLSAGQMITFGAYALTGQGLAFDGGLHQVGVQAVISGPPVLLACGGTDYEYSAADLNRDCKVDLSDLDIFVGNWLDCTELANQTCGSYTDIAQQRANDEAKLWMQAKFTGSAPKPPVSFLYGSASSKGLLDTWIFNRTQEQLDPNRTKWTLTYTDPASGLVATCEAIEYHDYPAVEWVVYFENTGTQDTPILSDVQAADYWLTSRSSGQFVLYHANGSTAVATDFQPLTTPLTPGTSLSYAPSLGRSSDTTLPFFNLVEPDSTGAVIAVGWSGQWAASFARDADKNVKVRAGMELTNLKLHP